MPPVYSTYEAKARFSEVLRQVRAGQRVTVSYRGKEVAEIRPIESEGSSLEARLRSLEADGIVGPAGRRRGRLAPLATKEGALKRFLDSRD